MTVINQTQATLIGNQIRMADSLSTRLFGLLGRRHLEPGEGLLIRPSSGIHTFGMRFPIDVVALDKTMRVIGIWTHVGPWRIRGVSLKTSCVLELAAGQVEATRLRSGDRLGCQPGHEPPREEVAPQL